MATLRSAQVSLPSGVTRDQHRFQLVGRRTRRMFVEALEARDLLSMAPASSPLAPALMSDGIGTAATSIGTALPMSALSAPQAIGTVSAADQPLYIGIADSSLSSANAGLVMVSDINSGIVAPLHATLPVTSGVATLTTGISGLAFDAAGNLWGSTDAAGSASNLVSISPSTGAQFSSVQITDGSHAISIGDLAFDAAVNKVYGIRSAEDQQGHAGWLYTVNTTTGAASLLGDSGTGTDGGLAFAPNGTLYFASADRLTGQPVLYTLDSANGAILTRVPLSGGAGALGYVSGLDVRSDGVLVGTDSVSGDLVSINPTTGARAILLSTLTDTSPQSGTSNNPMPTGPPKQNPIRGIPGDVAFQPPSNKTLQTVYHEDFESGPGSFTVNNSGGPLSGLWHYSIGREADGQLDHSPIHSFYYGEFETPTNGGNYILPFGHQGVIISPAIQLPKTGTSIVSFSYQLQTRLETNLDFVDFSVDNSNTITTMLSRQAGTLPQSGVTQWFTATSDLSQFAGQTIHLRFTFRTGDPGPKDPEGWFVDDVVIANLTQPGSIHGIKYNDVNNDGTDDPGDPGVSGVTITLTASGGSSVSTVTDSNGAYAFNPVIPGTYTLTETPPADSVSQTPVSFQVTVHSGEDLVQNIANTLYGSIHGIKYNDVDANGTPDNPPDVPIPGVTITLSQPTGTPRTTVTDPFGHYDFENVVPGTYTLTESPPTDSVSQTPNSFQVTVRSGEELEAAPDEAVLGPGQFATQNPVFAIANTLFGSIHGIKFKDLNSNGIDDAGDQPFQGVTISLSPPTGTPLTAVTDANGRYDFENVVPGKYLLTETSPAGWTPTTRMPVSVTVRSGEELETASGEAVLRPGQFPTIDPTLLILGNGPIGLKITKSDSDGGSGSSVTGVAPSIGTAQPGTPLIYTIMVTNIGPNAVMGASVDDTFPADVAGVTWTATTTVGVTIVPPDGLSGTGPIHENVNLPGGSSITYTATGIISPSAALTNTMLTNTATVTPPGGTAISAVDIDTLEQTVQFITPMSVYRPNGPDSPGLNNNPANPPATSATITGYVWQDVNQNGVWETNERGRSGWTVFLDSYGTGVFDPATISISSTANNGSGRIRVTTAQPNTFVTGGAVEISAVGGTVEANGTWTITVIDSTHFDLQGSTFTHPFTSGGTASEPFTVSGSAATVSNAASNGSGLIRVTTTTANTFVTGDTITISGVVGTAEANGTWTISVIDSTHFDLQGSTFAHAYTTGGSASTIDNGKYTLTGLGAGTYTLLDDTQELSDGTFRDFTFPSANPAIAGRHGFQITVAAGQVVSGSGPPVTAPVTPTVPDFGTFDYSPLVRPADDELGHVKHDAASEQANLLAALTPWQSFNVTNNTAASFNVTGIDKIIANSTIPADQFVTVTDSTLAAPQFPIAVAPGISIKFFVFYDPVIRSADGSTVIQQFPDWFGDNSKAHSPHTFASDDHLQVDIDAPNQSFPVSLVGGSTYDSDIFYDGEVDGIDLGRLNDELLGKQWPIRAGDPLLDPTSDINARDPNGADKVANTDSWPIVPPPAPVREIGFGDYGPLNVEFGRARSPFLDLDPDNSSGVRGVDFATTYDGSHAVPIADIDASFGNDQILDLQSVTVTITNSAAGDQLHVNTALIPTDGSGQPVITVTGNDSPSLVLSARAPGTAQISVYTALIKSITYSNANTALMPGVRVISVAPIGDPLDFGPDPPKYTFDQTQGNIATARVAVIPSASNNSAASQLASPNFKMSAPDEAVPQTPASAFQTANPLIVTTSTPGLSAYTSAFSSLSPTTDQALGGASPTGVVTVPGVSESDMQIATDAAPVYPILTNAIVASTAMPAGGNDVAEGAGPQSAVRVAVSDSQFDFSAMEAPSTVAAAAASPSASPNQMDIAPWAALGGVQSVTVNSVPPASGSKLSTLADVDRGQATSTQLANPVDDVNPVSHPRASDKADGTQATDSVFAELGAESPDQDLLV